MVLFAQSIGIIAFLLCLVAFNQKEDLKLKNWMSLSALFYSVHYYFLGSNTAAFTEIITSFRVFISKYERYKALGVIFCLFYLIFGLSYIKNYIDILPVIAAINATIFLFYFEGKVARLGLLISLLLWLIFNVYYFSVGGILSDILTILINIKTIIKYNKKDA